MSAVTFEEREMTEAEFARITAGFDEYAHEHGNLTQTYERFGFVAMDGENFIGSATGITYKNGLEYNGWFYLSDLFIEKPYRGQGLGATILKKLEERVTALGIKHILTLTAGYEAPEFYKKQGYEVVLEQENWYLTGHSRFTLYKKLEGADNDSDD